MKYVVPGGERVTGLRDGALQVHVAEEGSCGVAPLIAPRWHKG